MQDTFDVELTGKLLARLYIRIVSLRHTDLAAAKEDGLEEVRESLLAINLDSVTTLERLLGFD